MPGLSCSMWDLHGRVQDLRRGMWDLPGPGLKPVSSALAGRFLTTAPPGKSLNMFLSPVSWWSIVEPVQEMSEVRRDKVM